MFCTVRLHTGGNEVWLRVPNGWVLEKSSASESVYLISVTLSQLLSPTVKSKDRLFTSRMGKRSGAVGASQRLQRKMFNEGKSESRMEQIKALQNQVEHMTATIMNVQESLIVTQCLISKLLEGKLNNPIV